MATSIKKMTKGYYLPVDLVKEYEEGIVKKKSDGTIPSNSSGSSIIEGMMRKWLEENA